MLKKIIIIDHSTQEVHIYNYDENIWENDEAFVVAHFSNEGSTFKLSECSWMILNTELNELSITIH